MIGMLINQEQNIYSYVYKRIYVKVGQMMNGFVNA